MKIIKLSFFFLIPFLFSGCLIVGANSGYCESCGYKDDGFCGNPRDIYKNRYFIKELADKGIHNKDISLYLEEKNNK